jgi:hypothetical protein
MIKKKEGERDDLTNQIKIQETEGTNTKDSKETKALQGKTKDETRKEDKPGATTTRKGEERNGKGSTNNTIIEENKKEEKVHPMRIQGGEGIEEQDESHPKDNMEGETRSTKQAMTVTKDNLPFGHICDDIVIYNDIPYVRVYCQNVCGIFDRQGIELDSAFKEIKQAEADIFTFNETHGDESNATARRELRLSKQKNVEG